MPRGIAPGAVAPRSASDRHSSTAARAVSTSWGLTTLALTPAPPPHPLSVLAAGRSACASARRIDAEQKDHDPGDAQQLQPPVFDEELLGRLAGAGAEQ